MSGSSILILILSLFLFWILIRFSIKNERLKSLRNDFENEKEITAKLNDQILQKNEELMSYIKNLPLAIEQGINEFKSRELEKARKEIRDYEQRRAQLSYETWIKEKEINIRKEAINRSYSVSLGQIAEQVLPFYSDFPFNPKEIRFIGSPVDLIVFDGSSDANKEVTVYFLEIKTGKSRLSAKQKRIKEAISNKAVRWEEINLDTKVYDVEKKRVPTKKLPFVDLREEEDSNKEYQAKENPTSSVKDVSLDVFKFNVEELFNYVKSNSPSNKITFLEFCYFLDSKIDKERPDLIAREGDFSSRKYKYHLFDYLSDNYYELFKKWI